MASRFTPVAKIAKFKLDRLLKERQLLEAQIARTQEEIRRLEDEVANIHYPPQGSLALMLALKERAGIYAREIKEKQGIIQMLEGQKQILVERMAQANLEYEKMRHLESRDLAMELKRAKEREAKELDAIGLTLFTNRGV
ncbi:MAG: flagellar FliJ family protein [Campylobacterales bacterium]